VPARPNRLRLREIVFALAMGGFAAGGAAIALDAMHDDGGPSEEFAADTTRDYQVASFDRISTSGPQDIEVKYGDTLAVRAEGSSRALSQLEVRVENGRLTIGPKEGFFRGNWGILDEATVYVTVPKLSEVAIAGSGDVRVDRIEGDSFEGKIGGDGQISIADLKVDRADFSVAASGSISAAGSAGQTHASIAGSGEIDAGSLRSDTASISIAGSGDVALTVDKEAQVSITGSGDVDIAGPGHCSVTRFGSGSVSCAGGGGDENN